MLGDYAGCVSAPAAGPAQLGAAAGVPETGRARFVFHPLGAEPAHPLIAAALSIAGGLLLVPAFPGRDVWYLAPLAVAALALAVRGHGAGRAAWLGLLFGWACFIPLLSWSGIYVGRLPWFSLATLQALYVAAMAALMPRVWTAGPPRHRAMSAGLTVLGVSGLWVAQEALRARTPFGGFPWARVAFSQTDSPVLGAAAIGGAPAVTALVAAVGGCLAVAMVRLLERRSGRAPGVSLTLVAALALLLLPALVPRPVSASSSVQVAAVQGNVPRAGLDFNAERRAVLDNHAQLTDALAEQVREGLAPPPDVVIWPENSSDIDPTRNADAAQVIQAATDRIGVPVVVGSVLNEPVDRLSNASIVWGPTFGESPGPGQRYVKRRPAPFAEYVPYRSFFRMISDKVDLVRRDFVAGTESPVLTAGGVRFGDVICFEVAYDDLVRDAVRDGGQLLVVQTNNATFGRTDESVQQLAMSRLRAVETGRAVVHISTVGVSALIAPDGTMLERSGHFTAEVLQGDLPLRTEQTMATRVGSLPEWLLAAAGLGVVLAGRLRRSPR